MELKEVRIGELDQYLFGQGTHYDIYKKLGAHPVTNEMEKRVFILQCGHRMHHRYM